MTKVADWQLDEAQGRYNQDWTYAPLYLGLLATTDTTGDRRYRDTVLGAARRFHWKLWDRRPLHADDEAIAQAYELLYQQGPEPDRLADTRATFDRLLAYQDVPETNLWSWCDALFMAPAGLARLSAITGDAHYLRKMEAEWQLTQARLYSPAEHLFSRDDSYLARKEVNGKPLFWSRGNGWVMAGTVNVIKAMPKDDPGRPAFVTLLREMAVTLAGLQQPDGLWRSGLLDEQAYKLPEVSGSAFFTYAMAWGINEGLLERKIFLPVVTRAWDGMLHHVYADGRLGCIQPVGAAPDAFGPGSSYVYGVGGFLLAGSELDRLAGGGAGRR